MKFYGFVFKLALMITAVAVYPSSSQFVARFSSQLDAAGDVVLHWDFDAHSITFEIHAKTRGYVGFGISPNGGMAGSDIVIGWVKDGMAELKDRHATGNSEPTIDDQQDWELLAGSENETHTILRFSRKLKSCNDHDLSINDGTTRVIWSLGPPEDPLHETGLFIHRQRGTRSIQLLTFSKVPSRKLEEDPTISTWDLLHSNMKLPNDKRSFYGCRGFRIPDFISREKHHVVAMDVISQPGNEKYLHHIVLYLCVGEINEIQFRQSGGKNYECYESNNAMDKCLSSSFVWTIGSSRIYFPEDVGFAIGGPDEYPKVKYYRLELHYDNPGMDSGVIDSSGMRLFVTKVHKKNEAGILGVGILVTPQQIIPPRQESFTTVGVCHNSCLREVLAPYEDGVKVFSVLLHSHLAGRKMRLRHFRNGHELELIASDEHYDFNYQTPTYLDEPVTITKDDQLIFECVYSTEDRSTTTLVGLQTKTEMCEAFLYTYPKLNLTSCHSMILKSALFDRVPSFNNTGISRTGWNNKGWYEKLPNFKWSEEDVKALQEVALGSLVLTSCNRGKIAYSANWQGKILPKVNIDVPWKKKEAMCDAQPSSSGRVSTSFFCFIFALPAYLF